MTCCSWLRGAEGKRERERESEREQQESNENVEKEKKKLRMQVFKCLLIADVVNIVGRAKWSPPLFTCQKINSLLAICRLVGVRSFVKSQSCLWLKRLLAVGKEQVLRIAATASA
ncbi:hypothetical protein T07_13891 [Trichinella nelsoni]|uniref:Uncharacterized protein n=1 Tax=Trichinella nelsoni TaxID=6336 RepID=A0A0V0RUR4_9BILA|nr:hypothetical protein T07_13891 [Trichinella nelsoni]